MPAIAGAIGFKAKVSVTDGVSDAATEFDGLSVVTLPSQEAGEVETTDHGQTNYIKQFTPTLIDPGTLKIEIKASASNITRARALLRVPKTWKVTAPQTTEFGATTPQSYSVSGWLKKIDEIPFEREGIVMVKIEVRVTSDWTVAGGT
jgi:hypothetical protein